MWVGGMTRVRRRVREAPTHLESRREGVGGGPDGPRVERRQGVYLRGEGGARKDRSRARRYAVQAREGGPSSALSAGAGAPEEPARGIRRLEAACGVHGRHLHVHAGSEAVEGALWAGS